MAGRVATMALAPGNSKTHFVGFATAGVNFLGRLGWACSFHTRRPTFKSIPAWASEDLVVRDLGSVPPAHLTHRAA